jgi:hypothetical protein
LFEGVGGALLNDRAPLAEFPGDRFNLMFSDAATKTLFYGDYVEQFRVNVRISAFSVEFPLSSVEN